jgi:4-diphosphocytidyl-2-C-methyl-D-erythritol kinase
VNTADQDAWAHAWPAPAKLNLFLHVLGRRPDGYHRLQTVFRFIDLADTLRFAPRTDGRIVRATPLPDVPEDADLCVRAARLLQAEKAGTPGVTLFLDKRLPMGGGLGGGSSDAATVLLALNRLWGLGLSRARLQQLGLQLGADVPVFLYGRNAFAEGIGEELQPISLPDAAYLVLQPPVMVSTAAVFSAPELPRATPAIAAGDWRPGLGGNDLEAVVTARHPEVAGHLAWLRAHVGTARARMSGSGACVFAECADLAEARALAAQVPSGWRAWVARGLAAHPLADLAA